MQSPLHVIPRQSIAKRKVKEYAPQMPAELTVIVPVKDEQDGIMPFVLRTSAILDAIEDGEGMPLSWEILFVDDGSTDATMAAIMAARLKDQRIRALSFSRNFGKEAALSAGLDHASGACVIPIDVDMQDPPEVIGDMLDRWREGFDVVYGVRRDRQTDSLPKRLTADLYYRAHNWLSRDKIPEHAGDFRLLDRKVVDVIRALPERNRFMKGLYAWVGFEAVAVPYTPDERLHGRSRFGTLRLVMLALDGLTAFTMWPLRAASVVGVAFRPVPMLNCQR